MSVRVFIYILSAICAEMALAAPLPRALIGMCTYMYMASATRVAMSVIDKMYSSTFLVSFSNPRGQLK